MHSTDLDEASLSGLELMQLWIAENRRPPIGETLDFYLVEVEKGRATFEARPSRRAYNPSGAIHGGWASTLLDSACGCAAHSTLAPGQSYSTIELKVAFHRPITEATGLLRAEAKVLSVGRRVVFTDAQLADANGRLYASATSTLLITDTQNGATAGSKP